MIYLKFILSMLILLAPILILILVLIFPFLRKVSWKPFIALFFIFRALDIGISFFAFQRMGDASLEKNEIIRRLYLWLGFNNLFLLLFVLVAIFIALGFACLIRMLINSKNFYFYGYALGYYFIIGSLIVSIDWLVFLL